MRRAAITALGRLQLDAQTTTPLLIEALRDSDPAVVVPALAMLSEAGADALPVLVEALKVPQSRYWASLALAELGPQAKDAVGGLTDLLKADEAEVRTEAALALGEIGPAAAVAGQPLIAALADPAPAVRYAAAFALGKIGVTDSLPALERAPRGSRFLPASGGSVGRGEAQARRQASLGRCGGIDRGGVEGRQPERAARGRPGIVELEAPADVVGPASCRPWKITTRLCGRTYTKGWPVSGNEPCLGWSARSIALRLATMRLDVLRRIGAEAASAVPALTEILTASEDDRAQRELLFTLAAIGPPSTCRPLRRSPSCCRPRTRKCGSRPAMRGKNRSRRGFGGGRTT